MNVYGGSMEHSSMPTGTMAQEATTRHYYASTYRMRPISPTCERNIMRGLPTLGVYTTPCVLRSMSSPCVAYLIGLSPHSQLDHPPLYLRHPTMHAPHRHGLYPRAVLRMIAVKWLSIRNGMEWLCYMIHCVVACLHSLCYDMFMFTHTPIQSDFWSNVDKSGGQKACWPWKRYCLPNGYGRVRFNKKLMYAHRVAYILTHKRVPKKRKVCHDCDNPPCCNPIHFFLGTDLTNQLDALLKGRRNHLMQLSKTEVREIRKSWPTGSHYGKSVAKKLAVKFGVTVGTINSVMSGRSWSWLT